MNKIYLTLLVFTTLSLGAQNLLPEANPDHIFTYEEIEPIDFNNFEEAAQWADLIAIAQVINIDYAQTRNLNAKGQAFLNVLVPYKGSEKNQLIIVNEEGFKDYACYYPDRENEGQRLLVFLKETQSENEYVGFKPLCQLQVLVTESSAYALRYPMDIDFVIPEDDIETLKFADPNATIDATEWTEAVRNKYQQKYATDFREESDAFQRYYYLTYTQGVQMSVIRKLMKIPYKPRIQSRQF